MARWKKLLAKMLSDTSPMSYTYAEASSVLEHLGFVLAPSSKGSHRKWRYKTTDGSVVVVGLLEKGSGTLKAYLIRDMVDQLMTNGLVPDDLTEGSDDD
jgi:predicted RNA binding protein YcfA (HicA-like mRNA interferase family)